MRKKQTSKAGDEQPNVWILLTARCWGPGRLSESGGKGTRVSLILFQAARL